MLPLSEALPLIRSTEYRDFLIAQAREDAPQDAASFINQLCEKQCDTIVLLAYQSLIECLQAYPQIQSIRPRWNPIIEDGELIPVLRVDIESRNPDGSITEGEYRYEEYPPAMADEDTGAFDRMIDCCENVRGELWTPFYFMELRVNEKKAPYRSVDELEAEMKEQVKHFLASFEQWVMDKRTPEATGKPGRRPGL